MDDTGAPGKVEGQETKDERRRTIESDQVMKDKVLGDKVAGDKFAGNKYQAATINIYTAGTAAPHVPELRPLPYAPRLRSAEYIARGMEERVRAQLLASTGSAAVASISAPGGMGKTELVNVVAAGIRDRFEAVYLIEFGKKSVSQVLDDLAVTLGYRYSAATGEAAKERELEAHLTGKRHLFLFDDVRIENEALLEDFLPPRDNATLITSRIEQLPRLVPARAQFRLDAMDDAQSAALLGSELDRARLDAEPEATRQLIAHCAGNPLALEIAARRIQDYRGVPNPIALFAARLDQRASELEVGHDPRLNLYAVFDESYEPLSEQSKAQFRRLAVFANTGFAVAGAAALWQVPEVQAEETLREFQNLSLVRPTPGATLRYRLHDLLDEYAMSKLRAAGEESAWRDQHAENIVALFRAHDFDDLSGAPEVGDELDNLRRAAAWAKTSRNGNLLARLATTPENWLYTIFRAYAEWLDWLQAALALGVQDRALEARTWYDIGDLQAYEAENDAALASYREALRLFQGVGDPSGEAYTRKAIGDLQALGKRVSGEGSAEDAGANKTAPGDAEAALASYGEALALFRAAGDRIGEGYTLKATGDVQLAQAALDAARASYRQALELFQATGNRTGEAITRQALGDVQQACHEMDAARASYWQALELFQAAGDKLGEANVYAASAQLLAVSDPAQAQQFMEEAIEHYREIGDRASIAELTANLGVALLHAGQNERARLLLLRAAELFQESGQVQLAERARHMAA